VRWTRDHVAVLMHDARVDRTTDGHGRVSQLTAAQVCALNAAANWHGSTTPGLRHEAVPTLDAALEVRLVERGCCCAHRSCQLCRRLRLEVWLDCKESPLLVARYLRRKCAEDESLAERLVVCSFFPSVLYVIRSRCDFVCEGTLTRTSICSLLMVMGTGLLCAGRCRKCALR
jgi:glycerophosphoryl diester phosphodiesterase